VRETSLSIARRLCRFADASSDATQPSARRSLDREIHASRTLRAPRDFGALHRDSQRNTDRISDIGDRSQGQVATASQKLRHKPLGFAKAFRDLRSREPSFLDGLRQRFRHLQDKLFTRDANPQNRYRLRRREAVRDPSTSFALLTSRRMTVSADRGGKSAITFTTNFELRALD
jgi:hypothetical protein